MNQGFRILAWLLVLACLPVAAAQPSGDVARAQNLQQVAKTASQKGVPVLIVFTSPDCRYCDRVINYYLVPMQRNPKTAGTVIMRQMDMTSDRKLVDFHGKTTTEQAYARRLKVHLAPTIMVMTPDGKSAAKPLVGLGPEDYYGGYLDQAVATARQKMHPGSSP